MKILVIDFMYPLPENIGRRMRTMNFVRFFKQYGKVDLLYFYRESKETEAEGIFNREYFLRHPTYLGAQEKTWTRKVTGRWKRLRKRMSWTITDWPQPFLNDYLSIVNGGNFDFIFCRYIRDTYPLFQLPKKIREKVIIDFDDVFSEKLYGPASDKGKNHYPKIKDLVQKNFLRSYERKCLEFGAALFTSEYDREMVAGKGNKYNTHVIPNIHPDKPKNENLKGNGFSKRNIFLYIGALDYGPNIEGLKWFMNTIFRHLKGHIKDPRMLVVGRKPTPEIGALCHSVADVELHPDVPDVNPFYERSGVVVVPILTGGGTRIKILEAGIACRPVLTTPVGARGLDITNGKECLFFTDLATFLECWDKLNNVDTYDSIVTNMEILVKDLYSPKSFNNKMEAAVKSILCPE